MPRADAQANRDRILRVARDAFRADGTTSMNQIAQRAGVGAGTLYRNYPTREHLVLAVYQDEVNHLVEAVPGLLVSMPPVDALRSWTANLVDAMRRKHGLGDALTPSSHLAITQQTYGPVLAAITTLFDAGKQAGEIRTDADPGDFLVFTGALWRAPTTPMDRSSAMLDVLLDGLSSR